MTSAPAPGVTTGHPALAEAFLFLDSPAATRAAGLALGKNLSPTALVLLYGELGSGKTTLIKAACEALGIPPATVISPTYTLANVYPGPPTVYHVDLYRLERPEALTELDEHDWINPAGCTFIEWPEVAESVLTGRPAMRIRLTHATDGRRLHAVTDDPRLESAVAALISAVSPNRIDAPR